MFLSLYGLSLFSWLLGSKKCPVNGFEKWDKKWDKIFKKPENGVKTAILISKMCVLKSESVPVKKIEKILDEIVAPKTVGEIGIDCDLSTTLQAMKDIRDKYVLSRLL